MYSEARSRDRPSIKTKGHGLVKNFRVRSEMNAGLGQIDENLVRKKLFKSKLGSASYSSRSLRGIKLL